MHRLVVQQLTCSMVSNVTSNTEPSDQPDYLLTTPANA